MDANYMPQDDAGVNLGLSKTLFIAPEKAQVDRVPNAKIMADLLDAMLTVKNGETDVCICLPVTDIDLLRKCVNILPIKIVALDGLESSIRASEWALVTDYLDHLSLLELLEIHKQQAKTKAVSGQRKVFDLPKRGFNVSTTSNVKEVENGSE